MSGLWSAFFAEVALVSYRWFKAGPKVPQDAPFGLPLPSQYTAPMVVYATLGLLPNSLGPVPGLLGWGFVVATLLNLWSPTVIAEPKTNATPGVALA